MELAGGNTQRQRLTNEKLEGRQNTELTYHVAGNRSVLRDSHLGCAPFLCVPDDVTV